MDATVSMTAVHEVSATIPSVLVTASRASYQSQIRSLLPAKILPLDIRVSQNLLLAASFLGLLAKVLMVMGLCRVYSGQLQKDTSCNLFFTAKVLSIIAGALIFIAVILNYYAVINEEGIRFPPSFHIPFKPVRQEIGSTVPLAVLAAFLMLLSGLLTIFFQLPRDIQVYTITSQM